MLHSLYLEDVFVQTKRKRAVRVATSFLSKIDFDTIVVTGISGVSMGSIISEKMNKNLAVVRKKGEKNTFKQRFRIR